MGTKMHRATPKYHHPPKGGGVGVREWEDISHKQQSIPANILSGKPRVQSLSDAIGFCIPAQQESYVRGSPASRWAKTVGVCVGGSRG